MSNMVHHGQERLVAMKDVPNMLRKEECVSNTASLYKILCNKQKMQPQRMYQMRRERRSMYQTWRINKKDAVEPT